MKSANARDCLLHLARAKLSEREELVQLNDKFVDIIENVHYMEAEHAALEHDYNLLKTGMQSDSVAINELFDFEIRNVRSTVEEVNRGRQTLLNEQNTLAQQVKEVEQQWRHCAKAALGVPKEVDEDFSRISQIEAENNLTIRRIKYVEDKNRLIKQNNGRIYEQINLMRMRKDQAVSLHHEYILRKNELLNSIRNLEEDNKKIIMNEHKYFVRDRTVDRHIFRDQLRQAIADIRADYEFKRLKNEEEIRIRTETEIARIKENTTGNIVRDRLREELLIVKGNYTALQQNVSSCEVRNAELIQQIENIRLEISENHQTFETSLDFKNKEIEKLKEQCTAISLELEKLCDLNIDLQKEIAKYRELLDNSAYSVVRTGPTFSVVAKTATSTVSQNPSRHYDTVASRTPILTPTPAPAPVAVPVSAPTHYVSESSTWHEHSSYNSSQTRTPVPGAAASTVHTTPQDTREQSPYRTTSSSFLEKTHVVDSKERFPVRPDPSLFTGSSATATTIIHESYRPPVPAATGIESSGQYQSNIQDQYRHQHSDSASTHFTNVEIHHTAPAREITPLPKSARDDGWAHTTNDFIHRPQPITSTVFPATGGSSAVGSQQTAYEIHQQQRIHSSVGGEGRLEYSSDVDSIDEENFQRFTRWYKGRVKISDVTPEYIQLVNRSSKKSSDIGGYKLIHEFGHNSVYVDLPTGLILGPKESLKIFAGRSKHDFNSIVADIDLFDTTVNTNTSIRNMNNEVKSWFVYTSNTEVGDHHH